MDDGWRLYDQNGQWVLVFSINSSRDEHILSPRIKDICN